MNVERRQVAADPQTKPNDLGCESACRLPESTPTIAIYYYYYSARKLILILPSHGGLSRASWLVTYQDGLPARRRSPIGTNRVWRSATTLIEANALPQPNRSSPHSCKLYRTQKASEIKSHYPRPVIGSRTSWTLWSAIVLKLSFGLTHTWREECINVMSGNRGFLVASIIVWCSVTCVSLCLKNAPTLASCRFDKHELSLIILGKYHKYTFKNDLRIQLSLSFHFFTVFAFKFSCDGNDAKYNVLIARSVD